MNLEDIQRQIDQVINEQNKRSIPEFEGYSPYEMQHILHFTFGSGSPLSMQKLTDIDYSEIPMLNQIKYFLNLIKKSGEIKLTDKGFLPTKIVKEIYTQGFIEESLIKSGTYQLYKEADSMTVNLTRLIAQLAGLTKMRSGKLSLTKTGEKLSVDNFLLLELIFKTMTAKFNWAYYDGYGDNRIGQFGYGFSIILLSRYGEIKRLDNFYAEKYFKAFPDLIENEARIKLETPEQRSSRCYSIRTFDRFLEYFGLIKIETVGEKWNPDKYITKKDIFDKLFKVLPPYTR